MNGYSVALSIILLLIFSQYAFQIKKAKRKATFSDYAVIFLQIVMLALSVLSGLN